MVENNRNSSRVFGYFRRGDDHYSQIVEVNYETLDPYNQQRFPLNDLLVPSILITLSIVVVEVEKALVNVSVDHRRRLKVNVKLM